MGFGNNQPHRACWLKRQARPDNPIGRTGVEPVDVGALAIADGRPGEGRAQAFFHVLSDKRLRYQACLSAVMYYWYRRCGTLGAPRSDGVSRACYTTLDALVVEIPTCAVDRLENELGFVVLSRPWRSSSFEKCPEIEEDYVLMAEPDHLFLRPLDNLMSGRSPAAFPFFYIVPKNYPELIRRFAGST